MKELKKLWKYDSYFNAINCCCESFLDKRQMPNRMWDKFGMDKYSIGVHNTRDGGEWGMNMENELIAQLNKEWEYIP